MVDLSVYGKLNSISDYQRQNDDFEMKRQMQAAQMLQAQASMARQNALAQAKASEVNISKLGETAFLKRSQGIPTSPLEDAGLNFLDINSQRLIFNSTTGNMEQKPGLIERAGFAGGQQQPMRQPAMNKPPMNQQDAATIQGLFAPDEASITGNLGMSTTSPAPNEYDQQKDFKLKKDLAGAAGNPKRQQAILESFDKGDNPMNVFEKENKLRDDYERLTKDFRTVQDAWAKISTVSDTPAGDLSLIYGTAKLNDPGSVVREADFVLQAKAGNFGDRIQNMVSSITTGNRLTADQRANLINEAKLQYDAQSKGNKRTTETYTGLAKRNGLNVNNVITDYTETPPAQPTDKPASTAAKFLEFK